MEKKRKEIDMIYSKNNIIEDKSLGSSSLIASNLRNSRLGSSKLRKTSKFAVRKSLTNFIEDKMDRRNSN